MERSLARIPLEQEGKRLASFREGDAKRCVRNFDLPAEQAMVSRIQIEPNRIAWYNPATLVVVYMPIILITLCLIKNALGRLFIDLKRWVDCFAALICLHEVAAFISGVVSKL